MFKKFYFTFGSSEQFPFKNTFLSIEADSHRDAYKTFRQFYPDRTQNVLNCSFCYSESEWERIYPRHYEGMEPAAEYISDYVQAYRTGGEKDGLFKARKTLSLKDCIEEFGETEGLSVYIATKAYQSFQQNKTYEDVDNDVYHAFVEFKTLKKEEEKQLLEEDLIEELEETYYE